jgi:hypothetical protein
MRTTPFLLAALLLLVPTASATLIVSPPRPVTTTCANTPVVGHGVYDGTVESFRDPPIAPAVYTADWTIKTPSTLGSDGLCHNGAATCELILAAGAVADITYTVGGAASGYYNWLGVHFSITGGVLDCHATYVRATVTGDGVVTIDGTATATAAID